MQREKRQPRRAIRNKEFQEWLFEVDLFLSEEEMEIWDKISTNEKMFGYRCGVEPEMVSVSIAAGLLDSDEDTSSDMAIADSK